MVLPARAPAKKLAGPAVLRWTDRAGALCARLGDVLVVAIALMLFFEVAARYLFNAPTIWAQDIAIACQVWFTYLGMAYVLRQRQMIRITALVALAGPFLRRLVESFTLLVILAFCTVAVVYGIDVVVDSIRLGRRQPTMLEMPNWIVEIPVVFGFLLLGIQALADLIRLPFGPAPEFSSGGEHAPSTDGHLTQ
ncbi:putative integral membrane transport protein [Fulvimarina pelagi HTCC2506]|uniref:TRAP transporter small permease protein n=2 Tax=Fulvimarina pelagi TaxID=217511 RepID=Q0FYJ4_9HYPH|nr:TRAP transporter small permease [Fulvimarina pelagi]EAU40001.1 putative integral membrane transport protein [Fulvimarina pelagi HTCC2506]BAT31044.1 putative integral membrane transport protein [Fulvimarina pelagi]